MEAGWFTPGEKVVRCIHCEEVMEREEIPVDMTRLYILGGVAVAVIGAAIGTTVVVRKKKKQ